VQLVPGKSVYHDRNRQMFEFSTDLVNPQETELHTSPRSRPIGVDMGNSHTLRVLRIQGDWVQVVIMQPDTSACTGDEDLRVTRRDTVWVRKFNAQGKRQLTSAIAGC
jgi:hypothetical protein